MPPVHKRIFACTEKIDKEKKIIYHEARVFLTGINPATPIYPDQVEIDEYLKIIENYDKFMNLYIENRRKHDKSEISRTRMGINSLVEWIENECGTKILASID